jgi:hypothetical protein
MRSPGFVGRVRLMPTAKTPARFGGALARQATPVVPMTTRTLVAAYDGPRSSRNTPAAGM